MRESGKEFNDVLSQKLPKGLPPRREVDHQVEMKLGSTPQVKPPYRLNLNKQILLKQVLEELIDEGFIRPNESPYGLPMHVVCVLEGWNSKIVCILLGPR